MAVFLAPVRAWLDRLVERWLYGERAQPYRVLADLAARLERTTALDDLIATGGTACAAVNLLRRIGAEVVAACFVIDLPEIGGAQKLRDLDVPVRTLMEFDGH